MQDVASPAVQPGLAGADTGIPAAVPMETDFSDSMDDDALVAHFLVDDVLLQNKKNNKRPRSAAAGDENEDGNLPSSVKRRRAEVLELDMLDVNAIIDGWIQADDATRGILNDFDGLENLEQLEETAAVEDMSTGVDNIRALSG